jgi:predicted nuclease of restriction endonuclease-like (RecB) superfamily
MSELNTEYKQWIIALKGKIRSAQAKAAIAVNSELILLYWELGKMIVAQENTWGSKLIERISKDLQSEFPSMKGLTRSNLFYCKQFYSFYSNSDLVQQPVGLNLPPEETKLQNTDNQRTEIIQQPVELFMQHPATLIPWGHNILIFTKVKDIKGAFFYINQTIEKAWSRDWLLNAIKMDSYGHAQKQIQSHNFSESLPTIHSDYATEVFKDAYNLSFLGITEKVKETELEKRLVEKIKSFVLELGKGFTFIGNQHRLEYNNKEYFVDMLFFHRGLRSLVAIELKMGSFKAEYAGKMNLYLSLLDKLEKTENENQSIGIILCADKDHLDVEIALQDINKPIGVAEYQLLLPKEELQALLLNEIKASEEKNTEIK